MIVKYSYKQELIDNFQAKISKIMSLIDPDVIDIVNQYINLSGLPYRLDNHKTLGIVLLITLQQDDINSTENERIMSAFDIYSPGQDCIGGIRTGTIADIISTIKDLNILEATIENAITDIDSTILAAHKKSENN